MFGWGWEGNDDLPPDASTVTVTVEPADGGSRVTLVHEGLTEEQGAMHAEGWDHYLERLERLATTGDAGQDEWAWAPENLDPITAAEAALAVLQPVLRSLTAEDRPKPTPCSGVHLPRRWPSTCSARWSRLGAMAGATVVNPEEGSLENRVSVMAAQAIDAWRTVDLDGTVPGPGGDEMPAAFGAEHPADRAPAARLGHRPGQRPATARLRRARGLRPRPGRRRPAYRAAGAARSPTRSPRPTRPARSTGSRRTPDARRSPPDPHAPTGRARRRAHLNMPGGCEIEVYEAQAVPGI